MICKIAWSLVSTALLTAGSGLPTEVKARAVDTYIARQCQAIDGDTLRCGETRIRLLGIDAAELPGHCRTGRDCAPGDPFAQWRVLQRLASGPLSVRPLARDYYGRIVAQVRNRRGEDLSCGMLAAGAIYKPAWDNGGIIARSCGRPGAAKHDLPFVPKRYREFGHG